MRIEELLHAAIVAGKGRSEAVPVVECGPETSGPGDAQTSLAPAEPTKGERQ